ncbi:hypothetical protein ACFX5K_00540 [Rickettsiales bacterium LUAb2]
MKIIEKIKTSKTNKIVLILAIISLIIAFISFFNSIMSGSGILLSLGTFIIVWYFAYIILALCALLKLGIYKTFKWLIG